MLNGLNKVLREINGVDMNTGKITKNKRAELDVLTRDDFVSNREIHLKNLKIIPRGFFERMKSDELRMMH